LHNSHIIINSFAFQHALELKYQRLLNLSEVFSPLMIPENDNTKLAWYTEPKLEKIIYIVDYLSLSSFL